MKITDEFIESGRSKRGGWSKKQLAILGISWPPLKGWKQVIIGNEISIEQASEFLEMNHEERTAATHQSNA